MGWVVSQAGVHRPPRGEGQPRRAKAVNHLGGKAGFGGLSRGGVRRFPANLSVCPRLRRGPVGCQPPGPGLPQRAAVRHTRVVVDQSPECLNRIPRGRIQPMGAGSSDCAVRPDAIPRDAAMRHKAGRRHPTAISCPADRSAFRSPADADQVHQGQKVVEGMRDDGDQQVFGPHPKQTQVEADEGGQERVGTGYAMGDAKQDG